MVLHLVEDIEIMHLDQFEPEQIAVSRIDRAVLVLSVIQIVPGADREGEEEGGSRGRGGGRAVAGQMSTDI
jgi:hypothetical protein